MTFICFATIWLSSIWWPPERLGPVNTGISESSPVIQVPLMLKRGNSILQTNKRKKKAPHRWPSPFFVIALSTGTQGCIVEPQPPVLLSQPQKLLRNSTSQWEIHHFFKHIYILGFFILRLNVIHILLHVFFLLEKSPKGCTKHVSDEQQRAVRTQRIRCCISSLTQHCQRCFLLFFYH